MYCKNCNKMIPDGTTFCPYCGTPQQVQQNAPVGYQEDDSATVLVDNANLGYPNNNMQPQANPVYQQPAAPAYQAPVTPGYPPVNPGYPQQGPEAGFQPPMNPAMQQPAPKKSKTGLIIGLVVGGLVLIGIIVGVLVAVFSADTSSDYDNYVDYDYEDIYEDTYEDSYGDTYDDSNDVVADDSGSTPTTFSAAFQAFLDEKELTFTCYEFDHLDYSVYAGELANGIVDIQELGSDDDVIMEMYESICVPTTGYTQEQIDELDTEMRAAYAGYESLSNCLVDYYEIEDYYVIELYVWNLDDADNISELAELGFLSNGYGTYISLSNTATSLLSSGYVKG